MNSAKHKGLGRLVIKVAIFTYLFERYWFGHFEAYTETYRKFNLEELQKSWPSQASPS